MKNRKKRILIITSFLAFATSACGTTGCKRPRDFEPSRFERINYWVISRN